MKSIFKIAIVTSFLCLGVFGTAFAGGMASEAGIDLAPTPQALAAAENHHYDQAKLAKLATEAGVELAPTSRALAAAENHTYDQNRLARIGTEAGVDTWGRGNAPVNCTLC